MIKRDLVYAAKASDGELHGASVLFEGVSTDSRNVKTGNLYVPLVGERFDGHQYVEAALAAGAVGFFWERERERELSPELSAYPHVLVKDTLLALQALAKTYREDLALKVIGVTGSNGKTTTKEMIAAVLSTQYRIYKSPGNLNNHIGLPLSLLAIPEGTEVAVFEMGMNHIGEIALLASLAKPDIGVITMIGEAHVGLLGSRVAIARAKWELIAALPAGGSAVIPAGEPLLASLERPTDVAFYTFGELAGADARLLTHRIVSATEAEMTILFNESLDSSTHSFSLPVPGKHLALDAIAALTVGSLLQVPVNAAVAALRTYQPDALRFSVKQLGDRLLLINDAYNAAPASILAALQVLRELEVDVRIAVLGDMLELGEFAAPLHRQVGGELSVNGVNDLIAVGNLAQEYIQGAKAHLRDMHVYVANSAMAAGDYLVLRLTGYFLQGKSCAVLIKGSRKMGLEEVANIVLADFPGHGHNSD